MKYSFLYLFALAFSFSVQAGVIDLTPGQSFNTGTNEVRCNQTGSIPRPSPVGLKCNYQYSDGGCEYAPTGALCVTNSKLGICVQKDSTGSTADCKCVESASPRNPTPGLKCNYQYSDGPCENSQVGANCLAAGSKLGVCAQADSSGETADCKCIAK